MIYCVEDDDGIRGLMSYALTAAGFEVRGFPDSGGLFEAIRSEPPQLILLDIMLPGEDGLSILKRLRAHTATAGIPVIMATAKGTEYDKVTGLDMGADDYIAKPFGMTEMMSRVKAVLRRSRPEPEKEALRAGGLVLNENEHTVKWNHEEVNLTRKEYELLLKFMRHPGRVFTREELLFSIWGAEFAGETRTIDVHIGTLRTKLQDAGAYIKTVRGVGYAIAESQ